MAFKGLQLADTAFLGRAGNQITPASFPGLLRWWRSTYYQTLGAADGDSVGGGGATWPTWLDETGSGDNAAGGGIFHTNIFGTVPSVRIAGADGNSFMSIAPGALNDFTVVCVYQMRPATNEAFILYNNVSGHQLRTRFFAANDVIWYNVAALETATAFATPTAVECLVCRRSGSTVSFKENDVARGTFASSAAAWNVIQIGNSALSADQDFGEILIYNTALSDANLTALYSGYLVPKFTPLPP